jgi:hypothetical protein
MYYNFSFEKKRKILKNKDSNLPEKFPNLGVYWKKDDKNLGCSL